MTPATTPQHPALQSAKRRVALLVAGIWLFTSLPVVFGLASCPVARFLHAPCPGCGMTRAVQLLLDGEIAASLAMHPLAVPTALVQMAFAVATIVVALRHGTPFALWSTRVGRVSVYAAAVVLALDVVLWLLRFAGLAHGAVVV